MKILFFSDMHGHAGNLVKLAELDKTEHFDKVVSLGDMYYIGPRNEQTKEQNIDLVKDTLTSFAEKLIAIRGNCDADVDLKVSDFPICSDLALISVDGIDLYLTHGNVYNKNSTRKFYNKGVLLYGHEHIPYIETIGDMTFVCVGSISYAKNDNPETYAVYEDKKISIYSIDGELLISKELD